MNTPENVKLREEAAARRKVLKKQARKARAHHQVKCLEPGKKKAKRKPLADLYVKGNFNCEGTVKKCTKVNGPEDAIVNEMIKQLPLKKI